LAEVACFSPCGLVATRLGNQRDYQAIVCQSVTYTANGGIVRASASGRQLNLDHTVLVSLFDLAVVRSAAGCYPAGSEAAVEYFHAILLG